MSVVAKPLIDLNRVWYEWISDFKTLQKGKTRLRRAALSGDRSYLNTNIAQHLCPSKHFFNTKMPRLCVKNVLLDTLIALSILHPQAATMKKMNTC